MSVLQKPSLMYTKTFDSGETLQCGEVGVAQKGELGAIQVLLWIVGTLVGTEQVRVKLYSDQNYQNLRYASTWSSLSDLAPAPAGQWLGWVTCSFNRENVSDETVMWAAVEVQNYTRNADVFYIGALYDWPVKVYSNQLNAPHYGLAMRWYIYPAVGLDYNI